MVFRQLNPGTSAGMEHGFPPTHPGTSAGTEHGFPPTPPGTSAHVVHLCPPPQCAPILNGCRVMRPA